MVIEVGKSSDGGAEKKIVRMKDPAVSAHQHRHNF